MAETQFARLSPIAVLRTAKWVKRGGRQKKNAPSPFEPQTIDGQFLSWAGQDHESGFVIRWQPDTQPGTIKAISQFVILNDAGEQIGLVPIPALIDTGRQLAELLRKHQVNFPIAGVYVMTAPGDDDRIKGLLSDWGRTLELTKGTPGPVRGPHLLIGPITHSYFRALAKIGFHYAIKHLPTIIGNEPEFRQVRDFIREGVGVPDQFLRHLELTPDAEGLLGHQLAAIAVPGSITVNIWLFLGCGISLPQGTLVIPNPTTLIVKQKVAHYFPYVTAKDGRLEGGEVLIADFV